MNPLQNDRIITASSLCFALEISAPVLFAGTQRGRYPAPTTIGDRGKPAWSLADIAKQDAVLAERVAQLLAYRATLKPLVKPPRKVAVRPRKTA